MYIGITARTEVIIKKWAGNLLRTERLIALDNF